MKPAVTPSCWPCPPTKILPIYSHWNKPEDINQMRLNAIQHFFEHYKDLEKGKWVKVQGWEGPESAKEEILIGMANYNKAAEAQVRPRLRHRRSKEKESRWLSFFVPGDHCCRAAVNQVAQAKLAAAKSQFTSEGQEGLDELGARVAVVDVVGVFPHVDAQQGLVAGGQRGAGSTHVDDVDRAVGLLHQPGPARAEVAPRRTPGRPS